MSRKCGRDAASAVEECIRQCHGAEFPLAVLAEYLDELRLKNWAERELRVVERSVISALSLLTGANGQIA